MKHGKYPGDWYGCGTISNVFEALTERYSPVPRFKVCVFQDGNLVLEDIEFRAQPLCQGILEEQARRAAWEEAEGTDLEGGRTLAEQYRRNRDQSVWQRTVEERSGGAVEEQQSD